jgi:hypothetical protein
MGEFGGLLLPHPWTDTALVPQTPPWDLFDHAKDLFVQAMPLTWLHTQHSGPRASAYRKRLSRVKDAG